ncbi:MAG: hypothetical protein GY835_08925 [bacterium]|nr:hypothetical protein [bacterium]
MKPLFVEPFQAPAELREHLGVRIGLAPVDGLEKWRIASRHLCLVRKPRFRALRSSSALKWGPSVEVSA